MLTDYLPILLLLVFAIGFAAVNLALTHLIGPKKSTQSKLSVYESGVQPVGDTRQRISIRFGLMRCSLSFLILRLFSSIRGQFVFKKFTESSGYFILVEMLVFIGILFLGYIYAWKKGVYRGLESQLGDNIFTTTIDKFVNWGRKNSLWPMPSALPAVPLK